LFTGYGFFHSRSPRLPPPSPPPHMPTPGHNNKFFLCLPYGHYPPGICSGRTLRHRSSYHFDLTISAAPGPPSFTLKPANSFVYGNPLDPCPPCCFFPPSRCASSSTTSCSALPLNAPSIHHPPALTLSTTSILRSTLITAISWHPPPLFFPFRSTCCHVLLFRWLSPVIMEHYPGICGPKIWLLSVLTLAFFCLLPLQVFLCSTRWPARSDPKISFFLLYGCRKFQYHCPLMIGPQACPLCPNLFPLLLGCTGFFVSRPTDCLPFFCLI